MQNTTMLILAAVAALAAGFFLWQTFGPDAPAKTGSLPEIVLVTFPEQINADGAPMLGEVRFRASGARVINAKFDIAQADFFLPFEFDPEVITDNEGSFTFYVNTLVPQQVIMTLTLVDEQGRESKPYEFSFVAIQPQPEIEQEG